MLTTLRPLFFTPGANTQCGQTAEHIPQLVHNPALNASVFSVLAETKPSSAPLEHALAFFFVDEQHPFVVPQQLAIDISSVLPPFGRLRPGRRSKARASGRGSLRRQIVTG
ncbi:MAG: hypothetical protein MUF84_09515 [Anaerolineae bacterium]|nr:hypothetical protein [Anaerolineae bacterium]